MDMRRLAIIALAATAVTAHGSFDLMLLPGNDDRIYRYDPVNRVSLGAYGANESDMIAADNRGVSYAANELSSHVQSMDYSNGSHIATYSGISTFNALELKDNYFFGITGTSLRRTNISTGTTNALTLAANVAWQSLAVYGSHAIAIGLSSTDTLAFQSVNLNTLVVNAVQVSTATLTSGTNIGKAAVVYNSLTATLRKGHFCLRFRPACPILGACARLPFRSLWFWGRSPLPHSTSCCWATTQPRGRRG